MFFFVDETRNECTIAPTVGEMQWNAKCILICMLACSALPFAALIIITFIFYRNTHITFAITVQCIAYKYTTYSMNIRLFLKINKLNTHLKLFAKQQGHHRFQLHFHCTMSTHRVRVKTKQCDGKKSTYTNEVWFVGLLCGTHIRVCHIDRVHMAQRLPIRVPSFSIFLFLFLSRIRRAFYLFQNHITWQRVCLSIDRNHADTSHRWNEERRNLRQRKVLFFFCFSHRITTPFAILFQEFYECFRSNCRDAIVNHETVNCGQNNLTFSSFHNYDKFCEIRVSFGHLQCIYIYTM